MADTDTLTDPVEQDDDQQEREDDLLEKLGLHPAQLSVQQHLLGLADQGAPAVAQAAPVAAQSQPQPSVVPITPTGTPAGTPQPARMSINMRTGAKVPFPAAGGDNNTPSASMPPFPDSTTAPVTPSTPPIAGRPAVKPIDRSSLFSAGEQHVSAKHPFWGGVLKGLDVAGSILAPGSMAMVPGTMLNQRVKDARANNAVLMSTKLRQENALADQEEAKAESLKHPKLANAKVLMDSGVPYAIQRGDQEYVIGGKDMPQELQPMAQAAVDAHKQRVLEGQDKPDTAGEMAKHKDDLEGKLTSGAIAPDERAELATLQRKEKLQGVSSEATAQIGRPPVPADYPKGEADPLYKTANTAWGKAIQKIKMDEASAGAQARNKSFEDTPYNVLNKHTGTLDVMTRGELAAANRTSPGTWVLATQGGTQSMAKEANAENIRTSMENVKTHTAVLDRGLTHRALVSAALADPTHTATEFAQSAAAGQLEGDEQDYVIAVLNAREQIQGLRSMLMASGNSDARIRAIVKTLPNASTPSSAYANKQIDAAIADIDREMKGVPKVRTSGRDNQEKKPPATSSNPNADIHFVPAG